MKFDPAYKKFNFLIHVKPTLKSFKEHFLQNSAAKKSFKRNLTLRS